MAATVFPSMDATHAELFKEVGRIYAETKTLPDHVLTVLEFTFPRTCLNALDLVEKHHVTWCESPSGRGVYHVMGSKGLPYTCMMTSQYCGCEAFRRKVLKRRVYSMCKHVLAIRLAEAMGLVTKRDVSNKELADVIKNMD